ERELERQRDDGDGDERRPWRVQREDPPGECDEREPGGQQEAEALGDRVEAIRRRGECGVRGVVADDLVGRRADRAARGEPAGHERDRARGSATTHGNVPASAAAPPRPVFASARYERIAARASATTSAAQRPQSPATARATASMRYTPGGL